MEGGNNGSASLNGAYSDMVHSLTGMRMGI